MKSFWIYVSDALNIFWVIDENAKQRRHANGAVQADVADTATSLETTRMEATKLASRLCRHAARPTGSYISSAVSNVGEDVAISFEFAEV